MNLFEIYFQKTVDFLIWMVYNIIKVREEQYRNIEMEKEQMSKKMTTAEIKAQARFNAKHKMSYMEQVKRMARERALAK